MERIHYVNMNGLGNRICVIDMIGAKIRLEPRHIQALTMLDDMPFEQAMVLYKGRAPQIDASVQIFNRDGSRSGACGNGMRCVVSYMQSSDNKDEFLFETKAGLISGVVSEGRITVDMGAPKFDWQDIPLSEPFEDTRVIELQIGPIDAPLLHSPSVVNVGNPHAIFWVETIDDDLFAKHGALLEHHPIFPEGANISLAKLHSLEKVAVKVWERGVGLTQACGSAACAVVACGVRLKKLSRNVEVNLPGGSLQIEYRENNGHIYMSGPVEFEREGVVALSDLQSEAV